MVTVCFNTITDNSIFFPFCYPHKAPPRQTRGQSLQMNPPFHCLRPGSSRFIPERPTRDPARRPGHKKRKVHNLSLSSYPRVLFCKNYTLILSFSEFFISHPTKNVNSFYKRLYNLNILCVYSFRKHRRQPLCAPPQNAAGGSPRAGPGRRRRPLCTPPQSTADAAPTMRGRMTIESTVLLQTSCVARA